MIKGLFIAFVTALTISAQAGQRLDFKGVSLGSPPGDLSKLAKWFTPALCNEGANGEIASCKLDNVARCARLPMEKVLACLHDSNVTYAGFSVQPQFQFLAGRLESVMFIAPAEHFSELKEALTIKYGRPTHERAFQAQTKLGALVPGTRLFWNVDGDQIIVETPFVNVDEMYFRMRGKPLADIENAEEARTLKKRLGDV